MSHVFTLQLIEVADRIVGYVKEDGALLCLLCGEECHGQDAFDWHFTQEHEGEAR